MRTGEWVGGCVRRQAVGEVRFLAGVLEGEGVMCACKQGRELGGEKWRGDALFGQGLGVCCCPGLCLTFTQSRHIMLCRVVLCCGPLSAGV